MSAPFETGFPGRKKGMRAQQRFLNNANATPAQGRQGFWGKLPEAMFSIDGFQAERRGSDFELISAANHGAGNSKSK